MRHRRVDRLSCDDRERAAVVKSKECTKCREKKPLTEFWKDKARHDGHHPWCKACGNEAGRKYYETRKDKAREYYLKNREKGRAYDRERYQKNRKKELDYGHEYYQQNREKVLEYERKRRQTPRGREVAAPRTHPPQDAQERGLRRRRRAGCPVRT